MRGSLSAVIVILLASCSAAEAPTLPPPPPEVAGPPSPPPVRRAVLPVPPRPPHDDAALLARAPAGQANPSALQATSASEYHPQTVATLSAHDIITAADQARTDALGYIVWSKSLPDNITHMSELTDKLTTAVKQMEDHQTAPGSYVATDVIAARAALYELRIYLRTKGD